MHVTAALLVIVISPIYTHHRSHSYLYSSKRKAVTVEGKGLVEGETFDRRQVEHVVVMRECIYAHLHVIGCLGTIFLHIIKSIVALHIISPMTAAKSLIHYASVIFLQIVHKRNVHEVEEYSLIFMIPDGTVEICLVVS